MASPEPDAAVEHYIAIRQDRREIWLSQSSARGIYGNGILNRFDYHHSSVVPQNFAGLAVVDFSSPKVHRLTRFGGEVELAFLDAYIAVRRDNREIRIRPSHDAYIWDMANFFDYHHSAVLPRMENGIAVVDYSFPQLHRLTRSGLEFEFPSLAEADESADSYVAALKLKPGDVVLDLGAYAGASSYFLAKAVGPTGLVVAFEPDEATFKFLQANVARHHLVNVRAMNQGIWSETTTIPFQSEGSLGSSIAALLGRDSNVKTISVLTLEDAASLAGDRPVAAIKMDIEGAELAVLKEAGEFFRKHRPTLVVEVHFIDGRQPIEEVCEMLRSYDYSVNLPSQGTGDDGLAIGGLIAAWPR